MSERSHGWQGPTTGDTVSRFYDLLAIVKHPAVRLGFLDALNNRPLDHDKIMDRIQAETPAGALKRLGWNARLLNDKSVELAQYRYEEGRLLVIGVGLRCRAWGHPDYPPKQVLDYLWKRHAGEATPSVNA